MKVERDVGRLLGQNTRAARIFKVTVTKNNDGFAQMDFEELKETRDWVSLNAGCYLLRTNVTDWPDENLWKARRFEPVAYRSPVNINRFCWTISA